MVSQFRKKISEIGEEFGIDLIAKEVINGLLKNAGKGKDEVIQTLGREIGLAWAAVLKEPLQRLVDNKSLKITVELVGKEPNTDDLQHTDQKATTKKKAKRKTQKKKEL